LVALDRWVSGLNFRLQGTVRRASRTVLAVEKTTTVYGAHAGVSLNF
jgi:hypothetical protein